MFEIKNSYTAIEIQNQADALHTMICINKMRGWRYVDPKVESTLNELYQAADAYLGARTTHWKEHGDHAQTVPPDPPNLRRPRRSANLAYLDDYRPST